MFTPLRAAAPALSRAYASNVKSIVTEPFVSKVTIMGYVVQDSQVFQTQTGDKVAFRVGVERNAVVAGENRVEKDYFGVSIVNTRKEMPSNKFSEMLVKGTRVLVDGSLTYREFTDKQGQLKVQADILCNRRQDVRIIQPVRRQAENPNPESAHPVVGIQDHVEEPEQK